MITSFNDNVILTLSFPYQIQIIWRVSANQTVTSWQLQDTHSRMASAASWAHVSAAEGCRHSLCTQFHISNSGSQKEFLVKTQGFWRRKLPDVPQVSSFARSCVSDLKQACCVSMTRGMILYVLCFRPPSLWVCSNLWLHIHVVPCIYSDLSTVIGNSHRTIELK